MFPNSFPSPQVQPEGTRRVLLADLRLNRAALYVDLLTVFSPAYDTYEIEGEGLYPTASSRVNVQFAVNGVVDTAANYGYLNYNAGGAATSSNFGYLTNGSCATTGRGLHFSMRVTGANSPNGLKKYVAFVDQDEGASTYAGGLTSALYISATSISGVRFKWESGTTFQANGSVLVYGITRY